MYYTETSEVYNTSTDLAAKRDSDAITKKYISYDITRAQAAECHMMAVTYRGIISLLSNNYSKSDRDEYMTTYISDLKKYDKVSANIVERVYSHIQFYYLLAFCKYQASSYDLIAEVTLNNIMRYDSHSYNEMMQDTHKFVEQLRTTNHDDFYSRLL